MLVELSDELDLFLSFGYRPAKVMKYGMDGVRRMRDAKLRSERRQTLRRLRDRELIEVEQEAEKYKVALTRSGAIEVFRLKVLQSNPLPEGETCMVIFDIPESERELRRTLRRFLKSSGFICWQRSVWICFLDVGIPLGELFDSTGASKWVKVYLAKKYLL